MNNINVSIVIPLFNEAENVPLLFANIKEAMEKTKRTWEVIFIDDGSTDTTYQVVKNLDVQDKRVRVARLRRNFGQTAAMAAGFDLVQGDIIVTMDGDLQNDPADIPRLIDKLEEGYDLVSGWRVNRQDRFLSRRLPSLIANRLISWFTGVYLHDYGCTLKVLRYEIVRGLKLYGEMHRFIPALAADLGATIIEVPVRHHPRKYGRSKYGISRTIRVFLDLITVKFLSVYSTRPSHLFGLYGMLAMLGGLGITTFLAFQRLFSHAALADRPLLLLGILLIIIGVQFITMGLLGEVLSRAYHESQGKPIYTIKETLSLGNLNDRLQVRSVSQATVMN